MDKVNLQASPREVLGKKVKRLRKEHLLPGHVFGKGVDSIHISVPQKEFMKILSAVGETGLIDLKVGEGSRPVLVRGVQYDPLTGLPLHVDFYQVNLKQSVKVPVPIVLIGDEPESVHLGEAIVLQTLNEIEVEALPTDLIEKIEVDISQLKNIDDAITVSSLNFDRSKLTVSVDPEEIVVKLAPAVAAEMEALMEEAAAETAEAQAEATAEEGEEGVSTEGAEEGGEEATGEGNEAENKESSEEGKEQSPD